MRDKFSRVLRTFMETLFTTSGFPKSMGNQAKKSWINSTLDWLLGSGEPWTRYRTLIDILDQPEDDPDVRQARQAMLAHPQV